MKDSYKLLDHDVTETKSALADKANRREIDALNKKIDDLENRSKRYNVVIWSLKEGAEKDCSSVEEFLKEELFNKQMDLENMEVIRAHHTKINRADASTSAPQPRPIHVYLLRYPDKFYRLQRTPWKITLSATVRYSYPTTCQNQFEVKEPNYEKSI